MKSRDESGGVSIDYKLYTSYINILGQVELDRNGGGGGGEEETQMR